MNGFLIALQFLTRIPVHLQNYSEAELEKSLYWYGTVGFLLGVCLYLFTIGLTWAAPALGSSVIAALIVVAWVLITGALHLDGLADSADAWLGGSNKEKALVIMKDPRCGPAGVVSIVALLLLKFACLQTIVTLQPVYLILAPALARATVPLLFLTTDYVRKDGLGSPFKGNVSGQNTWFQLTPILLLCLFFAGVSALIAIALCAIVFFTLRASMISKIGGTTGDTAGASIEILEATLLLGLLACS